MSSLNKSEKRRGRPPKNVKNVTILKSKKIDKNPEEEQLVLYLPSFDDENEQSEKMSLIKKEVEPQTENNFTSFDSCSDDDEKFLHLSDKNSSNHDDLFDKITLTKENKKQLINLNLISINKNKINICEKTNIACWWCTYNFDTQPLFMPDHYKNNIYYVFGNYCSFSCMLAYNENMDDYRKGVRTALIKQLYREMFNCDDMNIKSAGPRELLDKFGGPMNITKYRDASIVSRKTFKVTIPPQIPLISDLEELVIEKK
jgi:hypothetical protein